MDHGSCKEPQAYCPEEDEDGDEQGDREHEPMQHLVRQGEARPEGSLIFYQRELRPGLNIFFHRDRLLRSGLYALIIAVFRGVDCAGRHIAGVPDVVMLPCVLLMEAGRAACAVSLVSVAFTGIL